MKRFIALILALIMALALCACGGEKAPAEEPAEAAANSKYVFSLNGTALPVNADFAPSHEKLGEESSYFEAASCAFNGLDKTYTYGNVEIVTYPDGDIDRISSIRFLDENVATPEGIKIGSSTEEVVAAYGEDFEDNMGEYSYTDGDTELAVLFSDGKAISVSYFSTTNLPA